MSAEVLAPYKFWSENPVLIDKKIDQFDSIVIIATDISKLQPSSDFLTGFLDILKVYQESDAVFDEVETFLVPQLDKYATIKRLVYSPTGPLDRDYDDVRCFADAAKKGIQRILKAGGKNPLLVVFDSAQKFKCSELVSLLGAAEAIYVPLEFREAVPTKSKNVEILGFSSPAASAEVLQLASAIEMGRVLCRDIGGSDPERMAAPKVAAYIQDLFKNTSINVDVIESDEVLQKEYPLLAAVNRATKGVERHRARLIYLTYEPEGPHDTTLVLVGKGITMDIGGIDIKTEGNMVGMHRDKCGAAAVAGFFQTLSVLKPKNIKVLGAMPMVRNSIGPDAYVCDELITSCSGARIRIVNTDGEGRMVMADVLYHLKEKVLKEKNVYLFTIATLTGHAHLTVGKGYSIVMENGPAKADSVGKSLQQAAEEIGDMFEISTIQREDYEFHKSKSEYEDLVQSGKEPSSKSNRGHQSPAAFLILSSGLDKHGINSEQPLKYCHIDIAGSAGHFPEDMPSGSPIPALAKRFLKN